MIEHWNSYWNEGFITSFGRGFKQNYQGVYQIFWEQVFSDLNNEDSVLDLATGNGGIPLLLLSYLKKNVKKISVTGTDLSSSVSKLNITNLVSDPTLSWDSLTILGNIDSADLPFEKTSFDLITSQYGFEYSPMANTVKEISRVANSGARIALVIHHSESFILKRNNSILDCIEQVLAPSGALFHFSNLIKGMGDITNKTQLSLLKNNSNVEILRNRLNESVEELDDTYGELLIDSGFPELLNALFSKNMLIPLHQKISMLDAYKEQSLSLIDRLKDLKRAAYSADKIKALEEEFSQSGILVSVIEELKGEEGLLGWIVKANRVR